MLWSSEDREINILIKRFMVSASKLRNLLFKADLQGDGERVDILYNRHIDFEKMDLYQKSHYRRYEFAKSIVSLYDICGDLACGTGYGSAILSEVANKVIGVDINHEVITAIRRRYQRAINIEFICANLMDLDYKEYFNDIVSFETLEHFHEEEIGLLFEFFNRALIAGGHLIFSTPYMQPQSPQAIRMGFHQTFEINERKVQNWLSRAGFLTETIKYQNYETHIIADHLEVKDFIICVARKR